MSWWAKLFVTMGSNLWLLPLGIFAGWLAHAFFSSGGPTQDSPPSELSAQSFMHSLRSLPEGKEKNAVLRALVAEASKIKPQLSDSQGAFPEIAPLVEPTPAVEALEEPKPFPEQAGEPKGVADTPVPAAKKKISLPNPNSEEQVAAFLKQRRRSEFGRDLSASLPFGGNEEGLPRFNGTYRGEVEVPIKDSEPRLFQLSLSMRSRQARNSLRGNLNLELREDNRVIASSSQQGELTLLRKMDAAGESYLLEINENHYAELFYISGGDIFIGNFYRRVKSGAFKAQGTLKLLRAE